MNRNDSMEAVDQMRLLIQKGGTITRLSQSITTLSNGLPYYFVEATSMEGSQYGIQAYWEDAMKLHAETMRMLLQ